MNQRPDASPTPGTPRRLPELLAPAGDCEAACAALQYGADAVYLGLPRFSARAEATNVTPDALAWLVRYAHGLQPRRSVYVTLNTLLRDDELGAALDTLALIAAAEADGVIVQDLGVYRLLRTHFPTLRIHASTQLAIHSVDGARALAGLGFARVVLARELSCAEIATVAHTAGIEVEVFVHGALCYSYSGLCLFSSHQAGRSGNRGRCAYCCRETFQTDDAARPRHAFSMRDLALFDRLPDLVAAGVASLKIEGRMKSSLYVAAVTDLYRRKLDGALTPDETRARLADLQTIFSRPWTELHTRGRATPAAVIDPQAVGHRGTPIGTVQSVQRERGGAAWLRFVTSRALEKHDGLQIELPAGGRPYGFAVQDLRAAGSPRTVVEVAAGRAVEVALPADAPHLPEGAPIFCSASQAVRRRYPVVRPRPSEVRAARAIDVRVRLRNDGIDLDAQSGLPDPAGSAVAAHVEVREPLDAARQPEATLPALRKAFSRLGDTRWELGTITIDDPDGCYLPPARMNDLRRELVARLDAADEAAQQAQRAARMAVLESAATALPADAGRAPCWSVKLNLADTPAPFDGADELVLRLNHNELDALDASRAAWSALHDRDRIRLALPLITRDSDQPRLAAAVARLAEAGWKHWECADLAGWHLLRKMRPAPATVVSEGALPALNRLSRTQLADLGITRAVSSPEDTLENLIALARSAAPLSEALIFQHTPLFIAETAPVLAEAPTDWPTGGLALTDRRGNRFRVQSRDGRTVTVAEIPFCAAPCLPRLQAAGIPWLRVDFSWLPLTAEARAAIWHDLRNGRTPAPSHPGNLLRGLP